MADPRVDGLARLLVERCLHVEAGWQVLVSATPLARPLYTAALREIARRGAYALPRLTFDGNAFTELAWVTEAPLELVGTPRRSTGGPRRRSTPCSPSTRPRTPESARAWPATGSDSSRAPRSRCSIGSPPMRSRGSAASTRRRRSRRMPA